MLPTKDSSTNRVFHGRARHILVEELVAEELVAEESYFEELDSEMVVRRKMTTNRFISEGQAFDGWSAP